MQQGNFTSINWGGNNFFSGYINNDTIFTINGEQVGVSISKYKEVEQALLKCKNRLIELGEIKVPKTQEQIIQEQSDLIQKQTVLINQIMEQVNGFKQDNTIPATEHTEQSLTSDTTSVDNGRPVKDTDTGRRS